MEFAALVRSRLRMLHNSLHLAGPKQRWTWIAMVIGWATIAIWLVWALVSELELARTAPERTNAIANLFFYLGVLMTLSAAPLAFGALFQSQDLGWLLATPTHPQSIAWLKLIDGVIGSSRVFLPFFIPAFGATAWALGLSPLGWVWALLVWTTYVVMVALLVQLLLFVVAQILGVRRVQGSIIALNFILSVLITWQIASNPEEMIGRIPLTQLTSPESLLAHLWSADALVYLTENRPFAAVLSYMRLVLTTLGIGLVAGWLGSFIYSDVRFTEAVSEAPRMARPTSGPSQRRSGLFAGVSLKDFKIYLREPQLLSQLAAPLLIMILPFVLRLRADAAAGPVQAMAITMVGITLYIQSSVLSLSSVALEGRAFWMVRTAPITPFRFLLAKWWFCYRVVAFVSLALTVLVQVAFLLQPGVTLAMITACLGGGAALVGLGVGLSALFPRFVYDNPAQRVSVWALLWGFGLYILYIACIGLTLFVGYNMILADVPDFWTWTITGSTMLLISAVFGLVPLVLGARRLAAYEWEH